MIEDLIIIHRKSHSHSLNAHLSNHWSIWKTCLRQLAFGSSQWETSHDYASHDEIYQGLCAYQFCLETICGLNSPLIGETEVYGQFKSFVMDSSLPNSPWQRNLRIILNQLLADAKKVRTQYLTGIGSQSYGSLSRKYLKGFQTIHIIGAGKLVTEMLPWITKEPTQIYLHCRRSFQGEELKKIYPTIQVAPLNSEFHPHSALIVAAPLTSIELSQLNNHSFKIILDFREKSELDPLQISSFKTLTLHELFKQIESDRAQIHTQVKAAKKLITEFTQRQHQHIEFRPFGWEDVCI